MMPVDKRFRFQWAEAVTNDPRLQDKPAQRFVLHSIAAFYVKTGQDTFKVRQETIARRFNVGVATVKRAIATCRAYGYLVIHVPRHRGTGCNDGHGYRLVIPDTAPMDDSELGITMTPNSARVGDHRDPSWGSPRSELGITGNAPSCENDPTISYRYLVRGSRSASGFADAPHREPLTDGNEPSRFCSQHPLGTTESCRACGDARVAYQVWEDRERQRRQARAQARAVAQQACRHCDHGWLLGDDGTPLEPATKCPHCANPEFEQGRSA